MPNLTKLGIIYNPGEANSVSLIEKMQKAAVLQDIQLILATANTSMDTTQATQTLIDKVEAIFINNDNTALSAFDSIVKISQEHKIPVFCSDLDMINHGAIAALGPDQYELGRQTGKMILKILNGENPNRIPVAFPDKIEQSINPIQAKKLGLPIQNTEVKIE